jgi:cytochrome P450 family 12
MSRSERYFNNPNEFNPKRWIKTSNITENIDPFSFLPFGFGARMCMF